MEAPKQTAAIFEILSRGQFINSNSSDESIRKLYAVIDDEQNFNFLYDYFRNINFTLEKGEEYYYFSRIENKNDLERKIEQAYKWIDMLDLLKTFDSSFGSGFRFSPSDILVRLNLDADLKSKLEGMKKYSAGKEKYHEIIEKILSDLVRDKFIDIEDLNFQRYKVLASFKYLEQLVLSINISEEVKNEIPE